MANNAAAGTVANYCGNEKTQEKYMGGKYEQEIET